MSDALFLSLSFGNVGLVVSLNRGTPTKTPTYHNLHYRDPQKATPHFGRLPFQPCGKHLLTCSPYHQMRPDRRLWGGRSIHTQGGFYRGSLGIMEKKMETAKGYVV